MRKLLSLILIIGFNCIFQSCATVWKLPPPKLVAPTYKTEYKATAKAFKKESNSLKSEKWDIVLDDLESVPIAMMRTLEGNNNWGQRLILPDALRDRVKAECKNPIIIKVFDTGSPNHIYLSQGQQPGTNYTNSNTVGDLNGHSTHVSGIMFGSDGLGVLSDLVSNGTVIWKTVKILGDQGQGSFSWVANAINSEDEDNLKFIKRGVSVIANGSFGGGTSIIGAVEESLLRSTQKGAHYFFASGNTGKNEIEYPAMSEYGSSVGALNQSMNRAIFSSYGPSLDFSMPGQAILSTWKDQQFATLSGTSMSSPFMTSAAAIALSKWGPMEPGALQEYLGEIATDIEPIGKDEMTGWGILFIQRILNTKPTGTPTVDPPSKNISVVASYAPNIIVTTNIKEKTRSFVLKELKADMKIFVYDSYSTFNNFLTLELPVLNFKIPEGTLDKDVLKILADKINTVILETFWSNVVITEMTISDLKGRTYCITL